MQPRMISHRKSKCASAPVLVVAIRITVVWIVWNNYIEILIVEYNVIAVTLVGNHKVTSPSIKARTKTLLEGCCTARA